MVLVHEGDFADAVLLVELRQILFDLLVRRVSVGILVAGTVVEPDLEPHVVILLGLEFVHNPDSVDLFHEMLHVARCC